MMSLHQQRISFAIVALLLLSLEFYLVLVRRDGTFAIEGLKRYEITEFADGVVVAHSFLMRGEGFNAISVKLASDQPSDVTLHWTLWRGAPEMPLLSYTRAHEVTERRRLRAGPQWVELAVPRDSTSHDRWYTIELQLEPGERQPAAARVVPIASEDNPDRGGVLWVAGIRKPGSLLMRAHWLGKTIYRRFESQAEPYLAPPFQNPAVQLAVVVTLHASLLILAYAILELQRSPSSPARE